MKSVRSVGVGLEGCRIGKVKHWKSVRLEECKSEREKDWKSVRLECLILWITSDL